MCRTADARLTSDRQEGEFYDQLFRVLTAEERRHTIRCLRGIDGPIALTDLADMVAAEKNAASEGTVSRDTKRDVYLNLYHKHVPTMADMEAVEFDEEHETVALAEGAHPLIRILETTESLQV